MVSIDWAAVGILVLNLITFLLVKQLKGVSNIRGGAISGWMSSIPGFYFLVPGSFILFGLDRAALLLIYALVAIISILIVFVTRDDPSHYNTFFIGHLFYYLPRVGIFMGMVTAALTQVLV